MRPTFLHINGTLYWTIKLFNSLGELIDADSSPTVSVRKNGTSTADVVTVTKRSATTGIYDCSYNPSGEIEGDIFTIEEMALVDTVENHNEPWNFSIISLSGNISSGVVTALDTNTPDVLLQIPKIGDTVKWTNQNAEEIIITYSEP